MEVCDKKMKILTCNKEPLHIPVESILPSSHLEIKDNPYF